MRTPPLRSLVAGPPPAPDGIFYTALWLRTVGNARYDELLPRLGRLDAYLLRASDGRLRRAAQYRAYRGPLGRAALAALLRLAARRYRAALCTEFRQLRYAAVPTVVDVDDTSFSPREAALLAGPAVAAYVVTTERAAHRFEALGVDKPWHVIPQGVSLAAIAAADPEPVRRLRRGGEVVIGYVASLLFAPGDPQAGHPLYDIGHLLDLWARIRERVPNARLWLLGRPSRRVRERLAGRADVLLLGWLPRREALAHVAGFDIALYPRQAEFGLQAVKVAEYLGAGVPTVSYDLDVVDALREGGGVLVRSPEDFVDAVVALAQDEARRGELAEAARRAGAALDWEVLADRYEREILDVHLR